MQQPTLQKIFFKHCHSHLMSEQQVDGQEVIKVFDEFLISDHQVRQSSIHCAHNFAILLNPFTFVEF